MHYIKSMFFIAVLGLTACAPKVAKETATTTAPSGNFRAMAPKPGPARAIEIGKSSTFKLSNGLTVVVVENHKLPQISYQLSIDLDPIQEKEKAGVASITGTLLATGTTTKTKAEIDEAVDYIGASLGTYASGGYASSLTKHTDKVLSLLSEVILKPSFTQSEFDKIKTQTLSGLQTEKDDPNSISQNVSSALTFGLDHPYGEITNEITVANISLEDARQYYNTYFRPGTAYLVIVGDITPEAAKAKAEKYFGSWSPGSAPNYTYTNPKPVDNTSVAFVDKSGAVQSVINVTYAVDLKPGVDDIIPARVMNTILGSGFSGRLFKNLREDKAYTYGAYSSLSSDELIGTFSAGASVRNEVTDSAIVQFMHELERLRNEPVTEEELALAKSYIAGDFARSLESPQTVANFARNILMYNLPADYYDTYLQRLNAVTIEDVTRVANKYITPGKARIIVVGSKDEVMPKLAVFDKQDGKVDLYDIYANPRKDEAMTVNIEPSRIIDAYLTAIGGKEKLEAVKTVDVTYTTEMMGTPITARVIQDQGKFYMSMTASGMNLMKQVYNGEKGLIEQMGQQMPAQGEDLNSMKESALLFPERLYTTTGYTMEVKGVEDINGKSSYKVIVTKPSGNKSTEFYDKESNLKLKEIQSVTSQGQTSNTTFDYGDYQAVNGIMIPHTMTISGPMPAPMVLKAQSVKVNAPVEDMLFKI